jgi:hypothetical protein
MLSQESLNYWLVIFVAYLWFDSWVSAFRFRAISRKLEEIEKRERGW